MTVSLLNIVMIFILLLSEGALLGDYQCRIESMKTVVFHYKPVRGYLEKVKIKQHFSNEPQSIYRILLTCTLE